MADRVFPLGPGGKAVLNLDAFGVEGGATHPLTVPVQHTREGVSLPRRRRCHFWEPVLFPSEPNNFPSGLSYAHPFPAAPSTAWDPDLRQNATPCGATPESVGRAPTVSSFRSYLVTVPRADSRQGHQHTPLCPGPARPFILTVKRLPVRNCRGPAKVVVVLVYIFSFSFSFHLQVTFNIILH